jgi:hypothetical protein
MRTSKLLTKAEATLPIVSALRLSVVVSALLLGTHAVADTQFKRDVQPLLTKHCVMCHIAGAAQADLVLYPDPWSTLVNVPSVQSPLLLVQPGEAEKSYLYLKLMGTQASAGGSGESMPFEKDPFNQQQLELIRDWIDRGAENN